MQNPEDILRMTLNQKNKHFNCADIERLTQRYIDNYLSEEETKLFNEHLDYCLPCDKKIEFELKLKDIIRVKLKEVVPEDFIKIRVNNLLAELK